MKVITASEFIPEGRIALLLRRCVMWQGPLGAPWDDVECDTMIVNPADFERIGRRLREPPTI